MTITCPTCESEDIRLVQPMWAIDTYLYPIEIIADCVGCGADLRVFCGEIEVEARFT